MYKKRYSCTRCLAEFVSQSAANIHLKRKTMCYKLNDQYVVINDDPTIPSIIDTPTVNCEYCSEEVKSRTSTNFIEQHLKVCKNNPKNINKEPEQVKEQNNNILSSFRSVSSSQNDNPSFRTMASSTPEGWPEDFDSYFPKPFSGAKPGTNIIVRNNKTVCARSINIQLYGIKDQTALKNTISILKHMDDKLTPENPEHHNAAYEYLDNIEIDGHMHNALYKIKEW